MLGTVRPTAQGVSRSFWLLVIAPSFVVASVSGAMLVGTSAWSIGYGLRRWLNVETPPIVILLTLVATVYGLTEIGLIRVPYVQRKRQVPSSWQRRWRPTTVVIPYGFALGIGVSTRVLSALLYLAILGTTLYPEFVYASMSLGLFGLSRAATLVVASWLLRGREMGEEFIAALHQLTTYQIRLQRASGITLLGAAAFLAAISLRMSLPS